MAAAIVSDAMDSVPLDIAAVLNALPEPVFVLDAQDRFFPAVEELIAVSKEMGARVIINNFSPLQGMADVYREAIETIEGRAAVADIHFSMHPFDHSVVPIVSFLPLWAQRGGMREALHNLSVPDLTTKIVTDLSAVDIADAIIHDAPDFAYLMGKTIKDIAEDRGSSIPEALVELMRMTGLRASLVVHNLSLDEFGYALASDRSMIVSSGASFAASHGRSRAHLFADAIPTYLRTILSARPIPLESAISKITHLPAQQLGLQQRGLVREGYFADLVLFRDTRIETVFVNGAIAVRDGKITDILHGKILAHGNQ